MNVVHGAKSVVATTSTAAVLEPKSSHEARPSSIAAATAATEFIMAASSMGLSAKRSAVTASPMP